MLDKNDYEIIGDDLQAVRIELPTGNTVIADPGNLVYMSNNIEMQATLGNDNVINRFISGLKRIVTGENFFLTTFKSISGNGELVLSSSLPGKILPIELSREGIICEKKSYLCSDSTVNIDVAVTKRIGAGLFGREGFILQKLTGTGRLFIHASGTIIKKTLQDGESIKLDPGSVVAFDTSVDYNVKYVGSVKTVLFGGVGIFFVTLTGPGDVYIQTLPFNKLSQRILSGTRLNRGRPRD